MVAGKGIKQFLRGRGRLHPIPNHSLARLRSAQARLANAFALQRSGEPLALGKLLRHKSLVNLPQAACKEARWPKESEGLLALPAPFSI